MCLSVTVSFYVCHILNSTCFSGFFSLFLAAQITSDSHDTLKEKGNTWERERERDGNSLSNFLHTCTHTQTLMHNITLVTPISTLYLQGQLHHQLLWLPHLSQSSNKEMPHTQTHSLSVTLLDCELDVWLQDWGWFSCWLLICLCFTGANWMNSFFLDSISFIVLLLLSTSFSPSYFLDILSL